MVATMVIIAIVQYVAKKNPQEKYKLNTCSEKAVGDAVKNYKNNKPEAIDNYLNSRLSDDGYNYDAKCMYIGALGAKLQSIKALTIHYINFYNKTSDKKIVDKLVKDEEGMSIEDIKKSVDSMKSDIKDQDDVLKVKPADLPPEMENANEKTN